MPNEIELDDDFILEEQRHREMVGVLNKVLIEISKDTKGDEKAVKAITELGVKIEKFATAIKSKENEEKEVVKVDFNPKELVSLVDMSKAMVTSINELKSLIESQSAPKVWEFEVKRNSFSQFIETVKATQK
jgi:hypothetical protein